MRPQRALSLSKSKGQGQGSIWKQASISGISNSNTSVCFQMLPCTDHCSQSQTYLMSVWTQRPIRGGYKSAQQRSKSQIFKISVPTWYGTFDNTRAHIHPAEHFCLLTFFVWRHFEQNQKSQNCFVSVSGVWNGLPKCALAGEHLQTPFGPWRLCNG